jgi:hypothetical protein
VNLVANRGVNEERWKAIGKTAPSASEQAAREAMEALHARPLSDQEWDRHAKRLTEFVKFLSRWDAEQRAAAKCAKMDSKADRERVA